MLSLNCFSHPLHQTMESTQCYQSTLFPCSVFTDLLTMQLLPLYFCLSHTLNPTRIFLWIWIWINQFMDIRHDLKICSPHLLEYRIPFHHVVEIVFWIYSSKTESCIIPPPLLPPTNLNLETTITALSHLATKSASPRPTLRAT